MTISNIPTQRPTSPSQLLRPCRLDVALEKLQAMETTIVNLRLSLDVLETEKSQIRECIEDEIRARTNEDGERDNDSQTESISKTTSPSPIPEVPPSDSPGDQGSDTSETESVVDGGDSPFLTPHSQSRTENTSEDDVTVVPADSGQPLTDPSELKREEQDWSVLFNPLPRAKRVLDVNLGHSLVHESAVQCVKFSQDGRWLATGCNWTAQIYDATTGAQICVLDHKRPEGKDRSYILSVCFSPDGKYLATGAEDKQIRVWDIAKVQLLNTFKGHKHVIYSLHFTSNGRFIISGSGDGTVRIWDTLDHNTKPKVLTIEDHYLSHNKRRVASVAISPDEKYLAVASWNSVLSIWKIDDGELVQTLRGHRDSVFCVVFTPDGKGLMSGGFDTTLKYWDISALNIGSETGSALAGSSGTSPHCLMNLTSHKDYVFSIAVSYDGAWAVSGSKDETIVFWDVKTGMEQCTLSGHQDRVLYVDLSPTSNLLASASEDKQVRIWSYELVS